MAKLRKMLGDINQPEIVRLMRMIETQSKETLAKWAVDCAEERYLDIYEEQAFGKIYTQDAGNLEKGRWGSDGLGCVKPLGSTEKLFRVTPGGQMEALRGW